MHNTEEQIENTYWDVLVVGGGPSGMMSAATAASLGKKVLLIEKNDSLGKKLLITGGGRCNLTNDEKDVRKFLEKYKDSDKFLFSAFSQFAVVEALDFFHNKNMDTKVEAKGRVFPLSNKAQSVWDVLVNYLRETGVTVLSNCPVVEFEKEGDKIISVKLKDKRAIKAKSFVLSTGGKSRPETGSTGDGFEFLKKLGHTVEEPSASLVPVAISDEWVKKLPGVSIENVKITILQNEVKQNISKGKILFTHFGLSGPTILNMSRDIGELLKYGDVELSLDFLPNLDPGQLNLKLQEVLKDESNRKIKNVLPQVLPTAVVSDVLKLANVEEDTPSHSVTRESRLSLVNTIKDTRLQVEDLLGTDKAIITSGGVDLREVDFKTMSSKLFKNLHLVGDILNIDRPSGGYSLQLCWTTGFVAGTNAGQ